MLLGWLSEEACEEKEANLGQDIIDDAEFASSAVKVHAIDLLNELFLDAEESQSALYWGRRGRKREKRKGKETNVVRLLVLSSNGVADSAGPVGGSGGHEGVVIGSCDGL